jgi:hypothetical protein
MESSHARLSQMHGWFERATAQAIDPANVRFALAETTCPLVRTLNVIPISDVVSWLIVLGKRSDFESDSKGTQEPNISPRHRRSSGESFTAKSEFCLLLSDFD